MNPAISAATMTATHVAHQRKQVLQRIRALPPEQATRERILDGAPALSAALERLLAEGALASRPDGSLRINTETMRARASANAKAALLVLVSLVAVAAGVLAILLVLR